MTLWSLPLHHASWKDRLWLSSPVWMSSKLREQSALLAHFHHSLNAAYLRGCFWLPLQCLCKALRWQSYDGLTRTASWVRVFGRATNLPFADLWMPGRQLPLGEVIKQPISSWRHLIVQPAPQCLAALGRTETGSHGSSREWAPQSKTRKQLVLGCDSKQKMWLQNIMCEFYVILLSCA